MFLFSFVSSGQLAVETKFTLCSLLKAEVLHGAIFVGILLCKGNFPPAMAMFCKATILFVHPQGLLLAVFCMTNSSRVGIWSL